MSSDKSIEDVKINAVQSESKHYRIKSYVVFLILLGIILLFLIFLGRIGNDVFGLIVFLIIFIIPALIIFKNKIPHLVPDFIANSLYEDNPHPEANQPVYSVSQRTKDFGYLFIFVVLLIGSIVLIAEYRKKIEDKMSFFKIMASLLCLGLAGTVLANITGVELSLSATSPANLTEE